jgi:hypothetical protein
MVLAGEDTQEAMAEAQQLPQNDGNNDDHNNENDDHDNDDDHKEEEEEDSEAEEEEGNEAEDEDNEDYTPLSDSEKDKMYHEANEIKIPGNESLTPIGRLWDLLNRVDITAPLEFRIKRVSRLGWEE